MNIVGFYFVSFASIELFAPCGCLRYCSSFAASLLFRISEQLQEVLAAQRHAKIQKHREELDCWRSSSRTRVESKTFKAGLVDYYRCDGPGGQLKCLLTGEFYDQQHVRASHLIKHCTDGNTMHRYGLPSNIDDVRNGLLLLQDIELAFDRKDICFLYDPLTLALRAKVLNPRLMEERMPTHSFRIFGSVDNQVLCLPPGVFPYRRVLSMHAKLSYSRALHKGWITDTEELESYFNVSDTGLQEPLGLGLLTWKQVHPTIHNTFEHKSEEA